MLIFKSRKVAARRFKKWVTSKVLPEIRRTGGYGDRPVALRELEGKYVGVMEKQLALQTRLYNALNKADTLDYKGGLGSRVTIRP